MSSNSGSGMSFGAVLTLIFITLKLTHVIDWSWFWVLSPIIAGFAFAGGILFAMIVLSLIGGARLTIKRK